ncbi:OmpA family protein [Pukyongiella litopenaei]|uniref:OmpA family protein n=1 Tax=Pukyongiella litopenaei TaxID=2605946 RepID=A0A2S0MLS8_9RHOB|nr:OmpA family protein [Pukyongiella litopenaei]AVO36777.1 OmpA family protein [Pukyongiella litopenaei]
MYRKAATIILAACIAACIAACSQEAGQGIAADSFGDATRNNTGVMSGAREYGLNLGRRFAREVPATINFAFNSALLDAGARQVLDRQADWIRQFPEVRFRVYGHTDMVGSAGYNQSLGLRRAQAAVAYLGARGIDRSRLEAVVSYGETRPVIDTSAPERRNRRTVTEVSGFVASHPTILDGKYASVVYREYVASAVPPSKLTGYADTGGFSSGD